MAKRACRPISNRTACMIVAYLCIVVGTFDIMIKVFFHNWALRQKQMAEGKWSVKHFEHYERYNDLSEHRFDPGSISFSMHSINNSYDDESVLRVMRTLRTVIDSWSVLPWIDFPQGLILAFAVMGGRKRGLSIFLVSQACKLTISFLAMPYRLGKHVSSLFDSVHTVGSSAGPKSLGHNDGFSRHGDGANGPGRNFSTSIFDDNNTETLIEILPMYGSRSSFGSPTLVHGPDSAAHADSFSSNSTHVQYPWPSMTSSGFHQDPGQQCTGTELFHTYNLFAWLQVIVLPLQIFMSYAVYLYLRELHDEDAASLSPYRFTSGTHHILHPRASTITLSSSSAPLSCVRRTSSFGGSGGSRRELLIFSRERPPPSYDDIIRHPPDREHLLSSNAAGSDVVDSGQQRSRRLEACIVEMPLLTRVHNNNFYDFAPNNISVHCESRGDDVESPPPPYAVATTAPTGHECCEPTGSGTEQQTVPTRVTASVGSSSMV